MIYEHTELRVRPGDGPRLTTDFAGVRHLLLQSPGCISAELIRGVDHPDTYLLRVGWDDSRTTPRHSPPHPNRT